MRKSVVIKSTKKIIAEDNDEYYYRNLLPERVSLGEVQASQEARERWAIRHSFYEDISRKYDIAVELLTKHLLHVDMEIIRSLAVFGDHKYIVDDLKIRYEGSF